ncbi:hypothetical protein ACMD2_07876 [Ananas comosus]|uniref:Uncharacterized protein n=1 Tax=Ananas comosus TaxID=4615 RepID=A0A199UFS2_ANACO|nr:hypothetical protein ACMD2_07876 [Ananas comosus]
MTLPLLHTLASLLVTCSRRVSRAARRLRPGPPHLLPRFLGPRRRKIAADNHNRRQKLAEEEEQQQCYGEEEAEGEGEGVWRRAILMGEKCQPLDFSGVIYYDSDGRRLDAAPAPRSPLRSPLPAPTPTRTRTRLG